METSSPIQCICLGWGGQRRDGIHSERPEKLAIRVQKLLKVFTSALFISFPLLCMAQGSEKWKRIIQKHRGHDLY